MTMDIYPFMFGLGLASVVWIVLGIALIVVIFALRKLFGEEGYPLYYQLLVNNTIRVRKKLMVYPLPKHIPGQPSDVLVTNKVSFWTEIFGREGEQITLNANDTMINEGVNQEDTYIETGVKYKEKDFYEKIKALGKDKDHWYNIAKKTEMQLNTLKANTRKEFEQFLKDHKEANRSGPIFTKPGGSK
jgi:hypothetical protein